MIMSNKVKVILIICILACGLLVACGTSTGGVGPAASQAQLNYRLTATAEVAATATEMVRAANEREQAAYARATEIAVGGINATLTAQEQAINDLAISQMRARATESAHLAQATRTAVAMQQTATSAQATATAQATEIALDDQASALTFTRAFRLIVLALIVIVISLGVWKFHTHFSFRQFPDGTVIKVDYPLFALLMPWRGYVPDAQIIIAPPGRQLPAPTASAAPADPVPYVSNDKVSYMIPPDAVDREHEYWTELTLQLLKDIRGKHGGAMTSIPHYRNIPSKNTKSGFWNSGPWVAVTDCLERAGAVDKKWGAKTLILESRNIDTLIAAIDSGEVGIIPPPRVGADEKKKDAKTVVNSEQSGTVEQLKQRVFTKKEIDDAVNHLQSAS
jgi:hypothetical protein